MKKYLFIYAKNISSIQDKTYKSINYEVWDKARFVIISGVYTN